MSRDCFALLDDHAASADDPRSRLYTGHVGTLQCAKPGDLPALMADMEAALRLGRHAVGVFSYELGAAMHDLPGRDAPHNAGANQVLLFSHCARLSADEVDAWLLAREQADTAGHAAHRGGALAGIAAVQASVSDDRFHADIDRILRYIEAGDAYQVNHTYRLRFDAYGPVAALYRRLRARQPVPYGALLALPDGRALLSLSPELLVSHHQGQLLARPMKGTAAASGDAAQDRAHAAALAADPKNRAENVMITDLLRNDLGRIAATGSVRVPELFGVQRHGQVLQMTSTVQATRHEDAGLAEVFGALYPCGSITGAPKRRALQIIHELETDARGFYTGALGWFDAARAPHRVGDFCLSVPIRTLTLQPPSPKGVRAGEMGVGAGIVHDSMAADELAECRLKAAFLTGLGHGFELFETLHASREDGGRHAALHLARLGASARYFGFAVDDIALKRALDERCAALPPGQAHRLRLALAPSGAITVQSVPLPPLPGAGPVGLLLSSQMVDAGDLFLRHKTTAREGYDVAWRAAEAQGGFDTLFFNTAGELTEGARSNVFVQLDGQWFTPPLACGLLPGVMRTVLLADVRWNARERRITRAELLAAEAVMVCNSLRGAMAARLIDTA